MKFNTNYTQLVRRDDKVLVYCEVPLSLADELNKLISKDVVKVVEIKQYREKRSLSSNAYCWVLCDKIAKILGSTAEEVYIDKLHDYGTCEYIGCLPDIIPELKKAVKIVEVKGNCNINGKQGVTLKLIRGSSTYDSKEMSVFIEGLVNDAKTLGIETLSPAELERMVNDE
jgi:hypothetical protein